MVCTSVSGVLGRGRQWTQKFAILSHIGGCSVLHETLSRKGKEQGERDTHTEGVYTPLTTANPAQCCSTDELQSVEKQVSAMHSLVSKKFKQCRA